jgi:methyl-accepting chemotaxis protein WspA
LKRETTETACVFYAPIESTGWGFAALLPQSEVLAGVRAQMKVAAVAMATILLIIIGLILFVSGRITRPIGQLRDKVLSIAGGNLDARVSGITSQDEIGELAHSFNTMAENLGRIVGQVRQSSIRLHSMATELTATSREQEATAASFGASASEIAASATEISATGTDLARTVHQVHEVATGTSALATDGQSALQEMESTMRGLDEATTSIGEKLATINTKAASITGVVKTIANVADQTNLLSVNAAIEAEKAGDYGVGFLVVAREIRRLADLTAAATLDIRHMVQTMQSAVAAGVMEMDRFADHVGRSVQDAATIAQQMADIIARVNENTASFKQINEGMHQQSEGAEQISTAMRELTSNADRSAEATREYVQVAADLNDAIHGLKSSIASFDLK